MSNLIVIERKDFDAILRMDFLRSTSAVFDYRQRRVTFKPIEVKSFAFEENMMILSIQA